MSKLAPVVEIPGDTLEKQWGREVGRNESRVKGTLTERANAQKTVDDFNADKGRKGNWLSRQFKRWTTIQWEMDTVYAANVRLGIHGAELREQATHYLTRLGLENLGPKAAEYNAMVEVHKDVIEARRLARIAQTETAQAGGAEIFDVFTKSGLVAAASYMETAQANNAVKKACTALGKLGAKAKGFGGDYAERAGALGFNNAVDLGANLVDPGLGSVTSFFSLLSLNGANSSMKDIVESLTTLERKLGDEEKKMRDAALESAIQTKPEVAGFATTLKAAAAPPEPASPQAAQEQKWKMGQG